MKAGNYGNLLVLIEQPRGEYAVTIAFLRLVTTLVKVTYTIAYPETSSGGDFYLFIFSCCISERIFTWITLIPVNFFVLIEVFV